MPVTTDELIVFLTKLRQGAIKGVKVAPNGAVRASRQDVLDLINKDLRPARAVQKRKRGRSPEKRRGYSAS
jgi:hypothetical protein